MSDDPLRSPDRYRLDFHDSKPMDYTKTFDVLVVASRQRFTLYENIFAPRSYFFRSALSVRWRTDPERPLDLWDYNVITFSQYLTCVYMGKVEVPGDPNEAKGVNWDALIALCLCAEKLGDFTAANLVMDHMVRQTNRFPACPCRSKIENVYHLTRPGNPLRQLFSHWALDDRKSETRTPTAWADQREHIAFLEDTIAAHNEYLTYMQGSEDWGVEGADKWLESRLKKCQLHQHDDDHPACQRGFPLQDTQRTMITELGSRVSEPYLGHSRITSVSYGKN